MGVAGSVLLVEDDHDVRESIQDALESFGYQVAAAHDGVEALERLRTDEALPGLILLDMMMPRMNGSQLREELLKVEAWSAIPVVVLTADSSARRNVEALRVAAFLQKPVSLEDLLDIVAHLLGEQTA